MADFSKTNDPNYKPDFDLGRVRNSEGRVTSTPTNKYIFEPQEDISSFELASIIPFLMGLQPLNDSSFKDLNPNLKKHIRVLKDENDEGTERITTDAP